MSMKHIFVVDDEKEIRILIKKYLEKEGYKVTAFSDGTNVDNEIIRLSPDLVVLDIMMPGIDGTELCKDIRKHSDIPIIFVSARGEEIDRIIGLEIGADDYLSKPFSPRELIVRIKNIFKRLDKGNHNVNVNNNSKIKDITLFPHKRIVQVSDKNVKLTTKEFEMLKFLMENCDIPFSREQLLDKIWGYDYYGENRIVDDIIKRLRRKLKESNSKVEIATVWGFGYKIES